MQMTSLGDQARAFLMGRLNSGLRQELGQLSTELSTGKARDLVAHLGGDQQRHADLDHRLSRTRAYLAASRDAEMVLSTMQLSLSAIDTARQSLAETAIKITDAPGAVEIAVASRQGRQAFDQMVGTLNARFGANALFAGSATDGPALAPANAMFADLAAAAAGVATLADLQQVVDDWFDTPSGGFASMGYLGDSGAPPSRLIDEGLSVAPDVRASSDGIRTVLKQTALAALAADAGLSLSTVDRARAIRAAGDGLLSAAQGLVGLQADLGDAEGRVEETRVRHSSREAALQIMLTDLQSVDPYTTAARLQEVQTQLETHYTVTARLQGLSLAGFLR
jgi:flagellar hook-associated protein 3 FlgL